MYRLSIGWLLWLGLMSHDPARADTFLPRQVADTIRWNFEKIRLTDGLPHNYVRCLHRDWQGILWFGTKGGLSRYDGVRLTSYSARTPRQTLPADEVLALAETPGRWLWIATFGGLAHYDYRTGELKPVATPGLTLAPSRGISMVFVDREGALWASDDERLARYTVDPAGRLVIDRLFTDLPRASISQLAQGTDGTIWVTPEYGAVYALRRLKGRWQAQVIYLPPHTSRSDPMLCRCVYADPQGILWLGTYSDGIIRYNPRTNQYRRILFFKSPILAEHVFHNRVRDIREVRSAGGDRLLYCATATDGLIVYNLTRQTFMACRADPANADGLTDDNVRKLLIDADHNLWLATEQGVNVYKPSSHRLQFIPLPNRLITHPYIDKVREAQNTAGHQLRYLTQVGIGTWQHDLRRNQFRLITGSGRQAQAESVVTIPVLDERGRWWVGASHSFGQLDPQTGRYTPVVWLKAGERPTMPWPVYLGKGHFLIWLSGRLRMLDTQSTSDSLSRQFNARLADNHPIHKQEIVRDNGSGIWGITEWSNRLTHIPDLRHPERWRTQVIRIGRQVLGASWAIKRDSARHCLWICTSNGLFQWSMDGRPMRYYGVSNGLAESMVQDMIPDDATHLWLVGNKGLSHLNLMTGKTEFYGAQEGFRTYGQYQYLSPGQNGYFFVGGPKGYHLVDTRRLRRSKKEARVLLTQVQLENQFITPEAVDKSLVRPRVVEAGQNDLRIGFVAMDGTYTNRNQYRYQLDGYDENWHLTTSQNEAIYTNLSPGAYRFRVRATNSDGVWSRQEAAFAFVIEPPLWQRWWFIGGVVGLVAGLLYGFYRYRLNQVLARERLRQRIAHDLHDEIGSTISSISLLSGLIDNQLRQATDSPSLVRQMVQKIHTDARQTLEAIDEIIWAVNPSNDSLARVVLRLQEYAQPLMEAQYIAFSLVVDPRLHDQNLPMEVRQSLYFVAKEALNNLLKYAGATEVKVHIGLQGGQLQVTITDNGCGFDPGQPHRRTGRRSMQQRAHTVGGQLQIESAPGRGTQVRFQAPLP